MAPNMVMVGYPEKGQPLWSSRHHSRAVHRGTEKPYPFGCPLTHSDDTQF